MSASRPSSAPTRRSFLGSSAATLGTAVAAPFARGLGFVRRDNRPVRIGVVGGGFGCEFHWHEHPLCAVVAVSDLRPARRERLRKRYGCDTVYPDLTALLGDEAVNAVAIFTEAPNHARHCIEAMQAGKHVISACPVALTLDDCAELLDVRQRTGRSYMLAETSYYHHDAIVARELYRKGAFGRLVYCEAEYYHPNLCHAADPFSHHAGERTWRYGYPPMLYPTHATAFLVGVTGERLTSVSCLGTVSDDPAFRDNVYGNRFANCAAMFRTSGDNIFRGNVFWQVNAHGERAQWLGEEGALYSDGSGGQPFRFRSRNHGTLDAVPDTWLGVPEAMRINLGHGASHPHITHEFVRALAEERPPSIDLHEAIAFTAPGIVAHASACQDGRTLEIPDFDPG